MDWKIISTTFVVVFLAELGDKTQLAALSLTAGTHKPISVFIGAAVALLLATAIGVAVGEGLTRVVSPKVLKIFGAVFFIAVGVVMLVWPMFEKPAAQ